MQEKGCQGTRSPVRDTGYGQLKVKGKNTHVVAVITELFRQGQINTLVGTKSLLGEGWDAPCINSLILATYVGSFMLSNQMRGRTIRTDRDHPEKTGNIWHLACIFPQKSGKTKHPDLSGDYEMLKRRFESFLGVSWKDKVIESGMERLAIPEFDTKEKMEKVNQMMLWRAADRDGLRARWQESLREIHGGMEVQAEAAAQFKLVSAGEGRAPEVALLARVGQLIVVLTCLVEDSQVAACLATKVIAHLRGDFPQPVAAGLVLPAPVGKGAFDKDAQARQGTVLHAEVGCQRGPSQQVEAQGQRVRRGEGVGIGGLRLGLQALAFFGLALLPAEPASAPGCCCWACCACWRSGGLTYGRSMTACPMLCMWPVRGRAVLSPSASCCPWDCPSMGRPGRTSVRTVP